MIIGNEIEAKSHSHHALQISISLDQPFLFECAEASGKFQGVIIQADISHSLRGVNGQYALLLLDPDLLQAKGILKHYNLSLIHI